MERKRASRFALVIAVALCSGCGDELLESFLVDINNLWTVRGAADHTFSFNSTTSSQGQEVSAASFNGEETLDGTISNLSGSYTGRQIQFTVSRSTGSVRFEGEFRDKNTIVVSGGGQTLTITRG